MFRFQDRLLFIIGGSGGGEERGGRVGGGEKRGGGAGGSGGAGGGVGGAEDFGCVTMKFTLFTHPRADCNILIIPHVDN